MAAFTRADPSDRDAFDAHDECIRNDPSVILRVIDDGNGLVGTIGSFTMQSEREVTYWIDLARCGEGLASEALGVFLTVKATRPNHQHRGRLRSLASPWRMIPTWLIWTTEFGVS